MPRESRRLPEPGRDVRPRDLYPLAVDEMHGTAPVLHHPGRLDPVEPADRVVPERDVDHPPAPEVIPDVSLVPAVRPRDVGRDYLDVFDGHAAVDTRQPQDNVAPFLH